MVDFLALDLNKFENQMLIFIETYYNLLKEDKDEPLKCNQKKLINEEWKEKIINILDIYINDNNLKKFNNRKDSIKNYLYEKKKHYNKNNLEFYMVMDIAQTLYEIYFDKKHKNEKKKNLNEYYISNMISCIYRELIELRNKLSHEENPPIEYILRFYEDQYYLIKYMKPKDSKVELSDYTTKDIKNNIHLYLSKVLDNKDKAFELVSKKQNFIEKEKLNKINDSKQIKEKEEAIKSIYKSTPFKMPNYNFCEQNIIKDKKFAENNKIDKINEAKKKEELENREIYEKSLDYSLNSFSNLDASSMSSEKDSINESMANIGNIKDGENITIISNLSKTDIQEDM